jgi:cytidine deaminase
VVTANGGSLCGSCRQVLAEFGLDTLVIIADTEGKIVSEMAVRELLPEAFRPEDLVKG